jgi:hypothetical protein
MAIKLKRCPKCDGMSLTETYVCSKDGTLLLLVMNDQLPKIDGNLVGTTIADRYELLEELSGDETTAMYAGKHKKTGQKVRIKLLKVYEPDAIALFQDEIKKQCASSTAGSEGTPIDFGVAADGVVYAVFTAK